MAHQADQALTAAIAQVLRQARDGGMSTREIADYFGVADATISRWETGARAVSLDLLPSFDRLVGQPRGYTLRLAGYVTDDTTDLRAAILMAPELDEDARNALAGMYDVLRRLPSPAPKPASRHSEAARARLKSG